MDELGHSHDRGDPNLYLLSSLSAQVGEVHKKMLSQSEASMGAGTAEPVHSNEEIFRTLIKVASLAIRLATEGDPNYFYDCPGLAESA